MLTLKDVMNSEEVKMLIAGTRRGYRKNRIYRTWEKTYIFSI